MRPHAVAMCVLTMAYETNSHVSRLFAHLPFGAGHGQIYEEHSDPRQSRSMATRALNTLVRLVKSPEVRLVVLTGDAGHGKTHLCRRLLEEALDLDPVEAHKRLMDAGKGANALGTVAGRELRIVKDLSEFKPPARGATSLTGALRSSDSVTVVCANEGKLREVVSVAEEELGLLRKTLEHSGTAGSCHEREDVHVIDLNNQAVTADKGENQSLVEQILKSWAVDGRSWRACEKCDARDGCPIRTNHRELAGDDEAGEKEIATRRRERLELLLRVAEESGTTITIRELLILTAFGITGGLDCKTVHEWHAKNPKDRSWQWKYLYFQILFEPRLTKSQAESLSLLQTLFRIDPGRNALRAVDDALAADDYENGDAFGPPSLRLIKPTPKTKAQARSEAEEHRELFSFLRRRKYFESDEEVSPPATRLGFQFHDEFRAALSDSTPEEKREIRDAVLRGLEAVQDIRRTTQQTRFAIVDPAFGNVSGNASILARSIPAKSVRLLGQKAHWKEVGDKEPEIPDAVDWIDRRAVIRFGKSPHVIELDALQFEFVMRSAHGLSCRKFFQGDIRRLLARLARLTQEQPPSEDDEIEVIYGDRTRKITIDTGDSIICSEN